MAVKLKTLDRDTPMLLPPDLRGWVPEKHIVHFLVDAVDRLPERLFKFNQRGTGESQYPPRMMLLLLIYCYATGRFSSRLIEEATYSDVIVRYICGGDLHPDHDTICTFRRTNKRLFEQAFIDVLHMASSTGKLKKIGTVSLDGTKVKANASKHAAVSYKRAGEQIEMLRNEVAELMAKAEDADSTPLDDGLSIPDEIVRREDRIESLEEARRLIEERHAEERQAKYEKKKARRDKQRKNGQTPKGPEPKPPEPASPPDKKQHNFTDPQSRIMKSGTGQHFEQAYNAQAVVEAESYLVVGGFVTNAPTDKEQLVPGINSIHSDIITPENVLADAGYFSSLDIKEAEETSSVKIYCAVEKTGHHRSVSDLELQPDPELPPDDASVGEKMKQRLQTKEGRALYNLRKQTVEPVFGIIKEVLGFRRFSMRGLEKADLEWTLVCLSYNLKKLFSLPEGCARSA